MRYAYLFLLFAFLVGCGGNNLPRPCADIEKQARSIRYVSVDKPTPDRYFVKFRRTRSLTDVRSVANHYRGRDVFLLESGSGYEATMTKKQVKRLLNSRDLRIWFVEESQEFWALDCTYGKSMMNQQDPVNWDDDCFFGATGKDVHAYIVDTGVSPTHPDFAWAEDSNPGAPATRIGECFNAKFPGGCKDYNRHGTHVASTVGGRRGGVAPGVIIHPVRVLGADGSGFTGSVVAGMEWVARHASENGWPAVLNGSFGGGKSLAIELAACKCDAAGVVVVLAAGNSNKSACAFSPSGVREAYVVGAVGPKLHRASFSNKGPCLDLFAPGVAIWAAKLGGGFTELSGSSMACPHIAGLAALCLEIGMDIDECLLENATMGKVLKPGSESPNRFPYFKPVK